MVVHNPFLDDDGISIDVLKLAEEKNIKESLKLNQSERFRIIKRLMKIDNRFSRAEIMQKKYLNRYGYNGQKLIKLIEVN